MGDIVLWVRDGGGSKLSGRLNISRDFSKQKSELSLSKIGIRRSGPLTFLISLKERNRYSIKPFAVSMFNKTYIGINEINEQQIKFQKQNNNKSNP